MPLQRQLIPINFLTGIDTIDDRHIVQPPSMLGMDNVRFITRGTVQKRFGYTKKGTSVDSFNKIVTANGQLLAFSQPTSGYQRMLGYDSGQSSWVQRGNGSPQILDCNVSVADVAPDANQQQFAGDVATTQSGSLTLYVWEETATTGGVFWCVKDRNTGALIAPVQRVPIATTTRNCRAWAIGNTLCLGYYDVNGAVVRLYYYNSSTGVLTAGSTISTIKATPTPWDVTVIGSTAYVCSYYDTGGNKIYINKVNSTAAATASGNIAITGTYASAFGVGVSSSTTLRVFWYDSSNGVQGLFVTASSLVSVGQKTIDSSTTLACLRTASIESTSGTYHLLISRTDGTKYTIDYFIGTDNVASPTKLATQRGQFLASKPMLRGGVPYFMAGGGNLSLNPSMYLFQAASANSTYYIWPVAKMIDSDYYLENTREMLPSLTFVGSTSTALGIVLRRSQLYSYTYGNSNTSYYGCWYSEARFDFSLSTNDWSDKLTTVDAAGVTHISGGFDAIYDGVSIVENGFFNYPELGSSLFTQSGAGGHIGAGTYQYAVVYEWRDAGGRIHESTPSVPVSVTIAAGTTNQVTIAVPTLTNTLKSSRSIIARQDITIAIYRTTSGGTTFYRVSPVTNTITNDVTADSVSFVDTSADVNITSAQILYNAGGVLDNANTLDGSRVIATAVDRMLASDPFNPNVVHYSKQIIDGQSTSFAAGMDIKLPDDGNGFPQAIAYLNNNIVVWRAKGIYVTQGEGLDDTGQTGGFPEMQRIYQDVGCVGPQMISETPEGYIFRSQKGYYLLGRDLSLSYIGAPVKSYESNIARSMDAVRSQSQVRILLNDATALVYDYRFGSWTRFSGLGTDAVVSYDSASSSDIYYLAVPSGIYSGSGIFYEDPTTYIDNHRGAGALVAPTVTTPWLAVAGIEGFQRVRSLLFAGEYEGDGTYGHVFNCDVYFDYVESVVENHQATSANLTTGGSDYSGQVFLNQQKCRAVKFSLYAREGVITNLEDMRLSNLTLEVSVKSGSAKNAPGKTF